MTCKAEIISSAAARRVAALAITAIVACGVSFPQIAFAKVMVDETELSQGKNAIGGGTATLIDSTLDMVSVKASELYTDENLAVNFEGNNEIEQVTVEGSAEVELNFTGENEVEEVQAAQSANVTINADGHNEFEEVSAWDDSSITINVTGENDFESIEADGNASIAIRGTTCQKRDTINLGEDENDAFICASKGNLTIDHVTVNVKSEYAVVGSDYGNVSINTSKVAKDDGSEYIGIIAGGTMLVRESVIDITGTVFSAGKMTINHSDVKAEEPVSKYGDDPYRIYSETGIELIDEKNGEVKEGEAYGKKVWYVDTDDNDGKDVDLEADGEPAYYRCKGDSSSDGETMPRTGDGVNPLLPIAMSIISATMAAFAAKRQKER